MGYVRHDAILVTSMFEEHIAKAHESAKQIFTTVSDLLPSRMNGYRSFLVPPDGSKEGWPDSDTGDRRRADFRKWVKCYIDTLGWNPFEGVYMNYGGDGEDCVGVTDLLGLALLELRCTMASEWAEKMTELAEREMDFSENWNSFRVAEALDAAREQGRIEGLAMAAGIAETQRAARIVARSAEPDFDRINELTNRAIGAVEVAAAIRARIEELQK